MPTANRRAFVAQAIALFMAQDYPRKQLVIVDNGSEPCGDLVPPAYEDEAAFFQLVDYVRYDGPKLSIGELRNLACERAAGDLIAHWDDDDWHAPNRLTAQVARMREAGARLTGLDSLVFYDGARAWLYRSVRRPWLAGGSLVYDKALWRELRFSTSSNGEDVAFLDAAVKRGAPIAPMTAPSLYVARIHGNNTTSRAPDAQWGSFDAETVRGWIAPRSAA